MSCATRAASTSKPPSPSGSAVARSRRRSSRRSRRRAPVMSGPAGAPPSSVAVACSCTQVIEAVERIVLPHRRHERPRQIDAHLPGHRPAVPRRRTRRRACATSASSRAHRLKLRLPCRARDLIERVHPLGQVVEVLAVAVPLELLVERLARAALGQRLADAQAAARRVRGAGLLVEPAQPAGARRRRAMPPQHVVHLIDQTQREVANCLRRCCAPARGSCTPRTRRSTGSAGAARSELSPVRSAKADMSSAAAASLGVMVV